jgi:hypothetical protein
LLLGLDVTASLDKGYVFDARQKRQSGWFPMVWGGYDVGGNGSLIVQRFDMNVEAVDFRISEQQFTCVIQYETRQEHRAGDFDNVGYTVSFGLQTFIGLASPLSHDDPLMAGVDFVHRSDHAINPGPSRVPPGAFLDHNSINLLPRFRLQTPGWEFPYRDPGIYERKTAWLNFVDWRLTAGLNSDKSTRRRDKFAGQLGVNWDIATVEGYVVYARALGSIGNELPDWQGELGVRRPAGKMFARYESYGMGDDLSRGATFVAGVGVFL